MFEREAISPQKVSKLMSEIIEGCKEKKMKGRAEFKDMVVDYNPEGISAYNPVTSDLIVQIDDLQSFAENRDQACAEMFVLYHEGGVEPQQPIQEQHEEGAWTTVTKRKRHKKCKK